MLKWNVNDAIVEYTCTVPNALYGGDGWKIIRSGDIFYLHEKHFVKIPELNYTGMVYCGTPHKEFYSIKEVEHYVYGVRSEIDGDDY